MAIEKHHQEEENTERKKMWGRRECRCEMNLTSTSAFEILANSFMRLY